MIDSKLFFVISCPELAHGPGATVTGAIQIEEMETVSDRKFVIFGGLLEPHLRQKQIH